MVNKIAKKYSKDHIIGDWSTNVIWKQEKDLKSIEENTQGTAFRKLQ